MLMNAAASDFNRVVTVLCKKCRNFVFVEVC